MSAPRTRSAARTLAAATLSLEAFVVFFAGLVARDIERVAPGPALGGFGALALACLLVAGALRSPWGYRLGWVLQLAVVAGGWWVPTMYGLGAAFAGLWWLSLHQGRRIDRERAEAADRASGTASPSV